MLATPQTLSNTVHNTTNALERGREEAHAALIKLVQ